MAVLFESAPFRDELHPGGDVVVAQTKQFRGL